MPGRALLDPGRRGLVILGVAFIGLIVGVVGLGALILAPPQPAPVAAPGLEPSSPTTAAAPATTAHVMTKTTADVFVLGENPGAVLTAHGGVEGEFVLHTVEMKDAPVGGGLSVEFRSGDDRLLMTVRNWAGREKEPEFERPAEATFVLGRSTFIASRGECTVNARETEINDIEPTIMAVDGVSRTVVALATLEGGIECEPIEAVRDPVEPVSIDGRFAAYLAVWED
ncbi:MAG TPA: hypothetical protein VHM94_08725 [Acidimicrobiia bacterium]|nr:hypothetical protein [Acidimicrobiia bacterium]